MERRTIWIGAVCTLAIIVFLAAVLAHAYIGSFARYFADDYCTASILQSKGLIEAQLHWYQTWSGRFSFTFVISVIELAGIQIVPFLPALALTLWLLALTAAILQAGLIVQWPFPTILSILMATLIIYATVDTAPGIVQSLYWQTGMLTYVMPLILLTAFAGIIMYRFRRDASDRYQWGWLIVSGTIAFFAGGFSETYGSLQVVILFFALVFCLTSKSAKIRRTVLPLVLAGLLGSVLAMSVIFLAPGNEIRQSRFLPPQDPGSLAAMSIKNTFRFLKEALSSSTVSLGTALIFSTLIGRMLYPWTSITIFSFTKIVQLLGLTLILGFIILLSTIAPAAYGMSLYPPDRALIIPHFILSCIAVLWGYLAGIGLGHIARPVENRWTHYLTIAFLIIFCLVLLWGPIRSVRRVVALSNSAETYASLWDERDFRIREAIGRGETSLTVPILPYIPGDLSPSPEFWINRCVAAYYGLDSIVGK